MADASVVGLLLTNRIATVDAKPFTAGEFWSLVERVGDLGVLLGEPAEALQRTFAFEAGEADRIARLLGAVVPFTLERESLAAQGIEMVAAHDERYPDVLRDRLRNGAPPMLYVAGTAEWLKRRGMAIVGARDVDDAGAEVAREAAAAATKEGLSLISGAARGVDRLAMGAAIDQEAPVVGITTEGVRRAGRSADLRRLIGEQRICIASPFAPDAPFQAGNAMARNKVIYGLAAAALVVSSAKGSGGTWTGAVEAIRGRFTKVLVWTGPGAGEGNGALVDLGGVAASSVADAVSASLAELPASPVVSQLSLLQVVGGEPSERTEVGPAEAHPPTESGAAHESPEEAARITALLEKFEHERLAPMGLSPTTVRTYRRAAKLFAEWQRSQAG